MLELQNSQVYFRNQLVPFSDANLSIASAPMLYGLSIYTVFPANWKEQQSKLYLFRLEEHFKRLHSRLGNGQFASVQVHP